MIPDPDWTEVKLTENQKEKFIKAFGYVPKMFICDLTKMYYEPLVFQNVWDGFIDNDFIDPKIFEEWGEKGQFIGISDLEDWETKGECPCPTCTKEREDSKEKIPNAIDIVGAKFAAEMMMIRDRGKLIVPTYEEFCGLGFLERDDQLKRKW